MKVICIQLGDNSDNDVTLSTGINCALIIIHLSYIVCRKKSLQLSDKVAI